MKKTYLLTFLFSVSLTLYGQSWQALLDSALYYKGRDWQKSLNYLEEYEQNVKDEFGSADSLYAVVLNDLGMTAVGMDDYDIAEQYFFRSLTIQEKLYTEANPLLYRTKGSLGFLYLREERYSESIQLLLEADSGLLAWHGPNHDEYYWNHNYLGQYHLHVGEYAKAEAIFIQLKE